MTVNVPLLTKILDHVVAHPDEWNQAVYAVTKPECGTAYCVAGHAVVMSGYDVEWRDNPGHPSTATSVRGGRSIPGAAAAVLGLQRGEADELFNADNTLRDLHELAHELSDGEIPIPDVLPDGS